MITADYLVGRASVPDSAEPRRRKEERERSKSCVTVETGLTKIGKVERWKGGKVERTTLSGPQLNKLFLSAD